MSKRTGPTNQRTQNLIKLLKTQQAQIWKRLAKEFGKATRKRREVNLSKIQRYAREKDFVLVPGKVLGTGKLTKPIKIAALNFSKSAEEKIIAAGGKIIELEKLIKDNPKGTDIRILG
ncbi:MAG: 50S ribosomal protein L18e [Candidatus Nanoarchaeia archaeon]